MYVISGVTGHTGGVVARTLLAARERVRVVVRQESQGRAFAEQGAEVAVGDLGDAAFLARALAGARGAYLLSPPNMAAAGTASGYLEDRVALIRTMAGAVKEAGLPALVFLSSVGAQQPSGTGPVVSLFHGEKLLAQAAPSVTFLRAAYFVENWASVLGAVRGAGVLPFFGDAGVPFAQVSTRDIGEVAADLLRNPVPGTRFVELAGPADASAMDVARVLGELLGKPVHAAAAPVEAAEAGLKQAGLPAGMAALYGEMYRGIASGVVAFEAPDNVRRGREPLQQTLAGLLG